MPEIKLPAMSPTMEEGMLAKWLVAEHDGQDVRIPFDALLVAVGRSANLKGYGLNHNLRRLYPWCR